MITVQQHVHILEDGWLYPTNEQAKCYAGLWSSAEWVVSWLTRNSRIPWTSRQIWKPWISVLLLENHMTKKPYKVHMTEEVFEWCRAPEKRILLKALHSPKRRPTYTSDIWGRLRTIWKSSWMKTKSYTGRLPPQPTSCSSLSVYAVSGEALRLNEWRVRFPWTAGIEGKTAMLLLRWYLRILG